MQLTLPARIASEPELDEFLAAPGAALIADMARLEGDIMILGVGGKMGPTLARMARRAAAEQAHHCGRPLHRAGAAGKSAARRHRDAGVRSARPGRRGRPSRCRQRRVHGRLQVRRRRRSGPDLGDERAYARAGRRAVPRGPDRRLLDRLRLSVRAGRPGWLHRGRGARSARRIRDELPRPRADYSIFLGTSRNSGPAVPAELRDRIALRRIARRGAQGAGRRAARSDDGARQRDLAGRRLRAGVAQPAALHRRHLAAQRQRSRNGRGALVSPPSSAPARAGSRARRARRRRRPGHRFCPGGGIVRLPGVPLSAMLDWVADWVAADRPSLNKPTEFEVRSATY